MTREPSASPNPGPKPQLQVPGGYAAEHPIPSPSSGCGWPIGELPKPRGEDQGLRVPKA